MTRLVLDTNVAVSGLLWSGKPRQLLILGREHKVVLLSSLPMLAELTDVLSRPKFAKRIAASELTVDQIVQGYAALVSIVRPAAVPRVAPDPDDDVVIGTALSARASLLVTGDQDLLSVTQYQGVQIVSVDEALKDLATTKLS